MRDVVVVVEVAEVVVVVVVVNVVVVVVPSNPKARAALHPEGARAPTATCERMLLAHTSNVMFVCLERALAHATMLTEKMVISDADTNHTRIINFRI